MSEPSFVLDHVSKSYHAANGSAVFDVCLEGMPGELVLLLGPSGSGKTTLLMLAAGLLPPTRGEVLLFGRPVRSYGPLELQRLRATSVGFVFQNHRLMDALSASANVGLSARFGGNRGSEVRRRALRALSIAGFSDAPGRPVAELSQGERQRVAVARALVNDPALIIADEPTASIDSRQSVALFETLRARARERQTCVLAATHDERLVSFADRVLRLSDGRLVAERSGAPAAQPHLQSTISS